MFTVITYDNDHNCTRYHEVADAIDYDDAEQVVKGLYPNERLMGITFSPTAEKVVEKPVENKCIKKYR